MGLRDALRALRREVRGKLEHFVLLDGSSYYYDRPETLKELYLHWCNCLRVGSAHNWPPAPEVIAKARVAKDVESALAQLRGEGSWDTFVYDPEVLIKERRLAPRGLVTYRDPKTGEWHVGDPYDEGPPEDLSE